MYFLRKINKGQHKIEPTFIVSIFLLPCRQRIAQVHFYPTLYQMRRMRCMPWCMPFLHYAGVGLLCPDLRWGRTSHLPRVQAFLPQLSYRNMVHNLITHNFITDVFCSILSLFEKRSIAVHAIYVLYKRIF